jgi:ATP-binding cassette subfamily B multidrug efflux pump
MAVAGEISAGDFTSFILYLQRMIWYLIALGYVVNLYQRGTASLKRFNSVLDAVPSIGDKRDVQPQPPIRGAIEFRDLNFSYDGSSSESKRGADALSSDASGPDGTLVLENINLKIEQGKTVAFVGRTGSGKSTLVSLVPRLIDAPHGSVLIDGRPVRDYPLDQLRRSIGFVPQETFLFSDTLAENIAMGIDRPESQQSHVPSLSASKSLRTERDAPALGTSETWDLGLRVAAAAEVAGLASDIKDFPGKYDQLVGERGITLSGGQKQRAAIARAVMRDPRILILDDSLSAVDTYTEEQILHNLRDVREDRTTLIVSHRVSTIRDADLICVLDGGQIIERGTHDDLIKLDGEYAELYERQLLEEELEATD